MPSSSPLITVEVADSLRLLGQQIKAFRKALHVSAAATAESAGMSRVTLHRIESGEPSVTMGAYLNAMAALGLAFGLIRPEPPSVAATDEREGWIPARVALADYPQLKQLSWQVHGTDTLTPAEALSIYERNWRHMDVAALTPREMHLIDALRLALGSEHSLV
jgi:transcriptional regulator with XRE-family HTH domain